MTVPRYDNENIDDMTVRNRSKNEVSVKIEISPDGGSPKVISLTLQNGESRDFPKVDELTGGTVRVEVDGRLRSELDYSSYSGLLGVFVHEDTVELVPMTA